MINFENSEGSPISDEFNNDPNDSYGNFNESVNFMKQGNNYMQRMRNKAMTPQINNM